MDIYIYKARRLSFSTVIGIRWEPFYVSKLITSHTWPIWPTWPIWF